MLGGLPLFDDGGGRHRQWVDSSNDVRELGDAEAADYSELRIWFMVSISFCWLSRIDLARAIASGD